MQALLTLREVRWLLAVVATAGIVTGSGAALLLGPRSQAGLVAESRKELGELAKRIESAKGDLVKGIESAKGDWEALEQRVHKMEGTVRSLGERVKGQEDALRETIEGTARLVDKLARAMRLVPAGEEMEKWLVEVQRVQRFNEQLAKRMILATPGERRDLAKLIARFQAARSVEEVLELLSLPGIRDLVVRYDLLEAIPEPLRKENEARWKALVEPKAVRPTEK